MGRLDLPDKYRDEDYPVDQSLTSEAPGLEECSLTGQMTLEECIALAEREAA